MKYTITTSIGSIAIAVFLGIIALRPLASAQQSSTGTPVGGQHTLVDVSKLPNSTLALIQALDNASNGGYRVKAAVGTLIILEKD
jgi:hypothetical protein